MALPRPGQGSLGAVSGLGACGRGTAVPRLSRSAPCGNYRGARRCGRAPRGSARWLEAFKLKAALGRGGGRGPPSKGRGRPGTATPLSAPAEGWNLVVSSARRPPPRAPAQRRSQPVPTLRSAGRDPSSLLHLGLPLGSLAASLAARTRTLPPGGPPRLSLIASRASLSHGRSGKPGLTLLLDLVTLSKSPSLSGPQCPL